MSRLRIDQLADKDRRRWVQYCSATGHLEYGRIKSWGTTFVFVVFDCDGRWDEYKKFTAAARLPEDLSFISRAACTATASRGFMYSRLEVAACAKRIGKSVPTLWRWIREGCDLRDPKSVREWQVRSEIRKTNIAKARERRGKESLRPTDGSSLGFPLMGSRNSTISWPSSMSKDPGKRTSSTFLAIRTLSSVASGLINSN